VKIYLDSPRGGEKWANKQSWLSGANNPHMHTYALADINDSRLRVCSADRYRICMSNEPAMPFSARRPAKSKSARSADLCPRVDRERDYMLPGI